MDRLSDRGSDQSQTLSSRFAVSIHSRVVDVGERSIRFVHELRKDPAGTIAATSTLVGVHIDMLTRKPCPLPARVVDTIRTQDVKSGPIDP